MRVAKQVSVPSATQSKNVSWSWSDYNNVPPSVAKFLKGQAERIRRYTGKSIILIGKDLIAAKHYLSHGAFLRWVSSEVGIPARTAQGYMQVAQWAAGKNANVQLLPPTLLYLLSDRNTPQGFIADILRRTEAGEHIPLTGIREELKALRASKRDGTQGESLIARRPPEPAREVKMIAVPVQGQPGVMEAIAILARALPRADFERIRDILTSKSVLQDPYLAQKIEMAFLDVRSTADDDPQLSSQASAPPRWQTRPMHEIAHHTS